MIWAVVNNITSKDTVSDGCNKKDESVFTNELAGQFRIDDELTE